MFFRFRLIVSWLLRSIYEFSQYCPQFDKLLKQPSCIQTIDILQKKWRWCMYSSVYQWSTVTGSLNTLFRKMTSRLSVRMCNIWTSCLNFLRKTKPNSFCVHCHRTSYCFQVQVFLYIYLKVQKQEIFRKYFIKVEEAFWSFFLLPSWLSLRGKHFRCKL